VEISDGSLMTVYQGWEGYQTSLVKAVTPLTPEQLAFRAAPDLRSAGELVRHISCGRLNWFIRMDAPGSAELAAQIPEWATTDNGNRYIIEESLPTDAADLVRWLEMTGKMVEDTLTQWTVADLAKTYRHNYQGQTYAVSHQWTIWRILSHDIHHGGQLSMLLYIQGIEIPELGYLGGHLTDVPLAEPE
jgi:uncharacterized damage-inducible protein DinB